VGSDLEPAAIAKGDVETLLEAQLPDVEVQRAGLVGHRHDDRPDIRDLDVFATVMHVGFLVLWLGGGASQAADVVARAYMSDPGVVSVSPVSISVFSPERIIGQPP
jgi:hypothetical protein